MVHSWRWPLVLLILIWIQWSISLSCESRFCSFPNALVSRVGRGTGGLHRHLPLKTVPMCAILRISWTAWGIEGWVFTTICLTGAFLIWIANEDFSLRAELFWAAFKCPALALQSVLILAQKIMEYEREKNYLQMSSFQAVEIILPLLGVKFCFLSVKNAWSCVTWDCHPCGAGSLWCSIILQYCSYIHKSHSETYEQCYEVSVWKKI